MTDADIALLLLGVAVGWLLAQRLDGGPSRLRENPKLDALLKQLDATRKRKDGGEE